MFEPVGHYTKWNKPGARDKDCISYLYVESETVELGDAESGMNGGYQELGGQGWEMERCWSDVGQPCRLTDKCTWQL